MRDLRPANPNPQEPRKTVVKIRKHNSIFSSPTQETKESQMIAMKTRQCKSLLRRLEEFGPFISLRDIDATNVLVEVEEELQSVS